jgi:hypothetical protein
MSGSLDIEEALRQLPSHERLEIALWLLQGLKEGGVESAKGGELSPALPDYSARRQRIFGNKVLPNLVLATRAEDRW